MHRTPSRRSRVARLAAPAVVAAVLVAACGDDDSEADTSDTAATSEDAAADGTEAPAPDGSSAGSPATEPTEEGGSGDAEFASIDEIAELCPADEAPGSITLSAWAGQDELIGDAFEPFIEATGVEIEWLTNDLGDRLTKMAAESGSPTIDAAIVPVNEVPALLEQGIIEETDTSIPNYDQLYDVAKIDGGYGTSIIQFGISYNPEHVTEPPTSWEDLFDPEYAGHVVFSAMPNSTGYATLSMLTRMEGGDDSDLSPGVERIAEYTDSIHSFSPQAAEIEPFLESGEVWIQPAIGGAAMDQIARGVPIEFVIPEEGGPAGLNVLVLPAGNDDLPCVKAFASYFLGEDVQHQWVTNLYYGSVHQAYEPPEGLTAYPNDYSTVVELDWPAIASNGADTLDLWNREVVG